MKCEPTNYRFEAGSFQIWAMFKNHTAAPVARAYKRAVDAARDAQDFARGIKSCEYRRDRIARFLVCRVDVREVVRFKKEEDSHIL